MDTEPKLKGVATFEQPGWIRLSEETREQPIKRDLSAETHEIVAPLACELIKAFLECSAEGSRSLVTTDHLHLRFLLSSHDRRHKPVMCYLRCACLHESSPADKPP